MGELAPIAKDIVSCTSYLLMLIYFWLFIFFRMAAVAASEGSAGGISRHCLCGLSRLQEPQIGVSK